MTCGGQPKEVSGSPFPDKNGGIPLAPGRCEDIEPWESLAWVAPGPRTSDRLRGNTGHSALLLAFELSEVGTNDLPASLSAEGPLKRTTGGAWIIGDF